MAMNLASVSRSRRLEAPKMLLAGVPKVGKSTFAASAPGAIFIPTEQGLSGLDVPAFPVAESLTDIYEAIGSLLQEQHDYQTVVFDSADWMEPLIHAHVAKANGWKDIESPGYGKGHIAAALEWRQLLDGMDALRTQRGMGVIVICHVKQVRVESPTHDGYDAWVLKTHQRAAALIEEWADIVGFAMHRIAVKSTDAGFGQRETKAKALGERVLCLEPHPAYPSGSRFGLRDCPLSWSHFAAQLQAQAPTKD